MTNEVFGGLPLSACRFEASGRAEAHSIPVDTLLVWSGGNSFVDLECGGHHHAVRRRSGMVDFLPAGLVIDQVRWRGQPMSCISVALPPPLLEALGVRRRIVAPERALRIGVEDSHIVSLVHRLHARASGGQPLVPLHADGLSLALASYVYSHFAGESESTPAPGPRLTLAQRELLVALIEARIAEPIRLVELAAAVGYSQDHFLRLFGASFGLSPHRYVTSRRVEHAKAMLKDPERSLVAVAFACGFSSQAHFNTVFKQRVGITPGRYRSAELAERVRVAGGGPHARGAWPDQEREHAGAAPPFGPGALPLGGHARQPGRHDVREP